METIHNLQEITPKDSPTVGTKATALSNLLRAGFNVPPGIVLTTTAYAHAIGKLQDRINARLTTAVIDDPGELEPAAGEVRQWIIQEPWDESMTGELETALDAIRAGR